jgi:hypothetical protein
MEPVLAALKETPIPTILVVAGIMFLLLSIAGQLVGRIAVPPERQRWAAVMGGILLMAGVALHVVPPAQLLSPQRSEVPTREPATKDEPPSLSLEVPPSTPSPSRPPAPPPQARDEVIPSLNARLTALRFFEGNPCEKSSPERRAYGQRFAQVLTREILTELTLEHPKHARRLDFTIQAFYRHEGKVIGRPELETYLSADKQVSVYWFNKRTGSLRVCTKPYPCGRWSVGSYTVDVYINGEKVASGSFEIYE